MPRLEIREEFQVMPPTTLYSVVSRTEGLVIRFTAYGDQADEVVLSAMNEKIASDDGWDGFLEAITRARYSLNGRATRFSILAQEIPVECIIWHRERVIECNESLDEEANLTTYHLLTV